MSVERGRAWAGWLLVLLVLAVALGGCDRIRRNPRPTPTPDVPIVGADVAAASIGTELRVRMRVECTDIEPRGGPVYLRPNCFYEGFFFRLVIPPEEHENFEQVLRGPAVVQLVDHVVDAHGVVQRNGMWSEIVLESPQQLRVITGWSVGYVPTRVPTPAATPAG